MRCASVQSTRKVREQIWVVDMVLLVGFEGYGGRAKNPSEAIVEALNEQVIDDISVKGVVLPVQFQGLVDRVAALLDAHQPKVIIAFGLWPGEPVIRLERVGLNTADFEIADNTGDLVQKMPVMPHRPDAHLTTLPLYAIQTQLLEAGIPARLSGSAGTYLCNALMFSLLDYCAQYLPETRCGFIHVPYLPMQAAEMLQGLAQEASLEFHQRSDTASMSLEMMVNAANLAIQATLDSIA